VSATQAIDLSGGLEAAPNVPAAQPNQAIDLSGGLEPVPAQADDSLGAAGRFVSGAASEVGGALGGTVDTLKRVVKDAVAQPEDANETAIHAAGGQVGLAAYRAANSVVQAAQNLVKAKKDSFGQASTDFVRTAQDLHSGNWRQALSDAGSTAGDLTSLNPASAPGTGERIREVSEGTRPEGDLATPLGKTGADLGMAFLGEKAPEASKAIEGVNDVASRVANKINTTELHPEQLTKRPETPAAQHGAPLRVESPLDGPTVGRQLGGKDLSQEALNTLQQHVGDTIPVGGSARNSLFSAVEPVSKAISDGVSKMNAAVKDSPAFTTSITQDNGLGKGTLNSDLEAMKKRLPASDRAKLSADVDDVLLDADKALNSNDPIEILEQRRQLGRQIDWDKIEKNPSTPQETGNAARAKVYRALGEKIHDEIPTTVEIDKGLQPNLELLSHMKSKLGERVVDDPHAATVEHQSELKKGKAAIENTAHNEVVAKNWGRVKTALITLGVGGGIIREIEHLIE
jgi:hypothetical protein